jgi:thiamine pyrophosphate-dependent acetolactate synthase large subunit-like protein
VRWRSQDKLGHGFPAVPGVKVANPEKQVVSIRGDGGFLFGASDLATALEHGIATIPAGVRPSPWHFIHMPRVRR